MVVLVATPSLITQYVVYSENMNANRIRTRTFRENTWTRTRIFSKVSNTNTFLPWNIEHERTRTLIFFLKRWTRTNTTTFSLQIIEHCENERTRILVYFIPGLRYLISNKLICPNWNGSQFQIHHIESSNHCMLTGVKNRQNRFYDKRYEGIFVNSVALSISDLKIKTP